MTSEGVAGEVRRRSVSANVVASCLLIVVTVIGFFMGQGMPASGADWPEARFASGVMGAVLGSIFGSVLSGMLVGLVKLAQRSQLLHEAREAQARFEGYLQTHKDFELAMEPLHVSGARWALKAAGQPIGMITDFEAEVFRYTIAASSQPLTLVERTRTEVIVSRLVRGVHHHSQEWAMRIYALGSRQDGADFRDYYFLRGRPVTREQLLEEADRPQSQPEPQTPAEAPRPAPRPKEPARMTDALPRLPKLPGVTREMHGLSA